MSKNHTRVKFCTADCKNRDTLSLECERKSTYIKENGQCGDYVKND